MKVLVIGQGGREHAIIRALRNSPTVTEVHALPGNDGYFKEAICHKISTSDFSEIQKLNLKNAYGLIVVGPEVPLAEGLSDFLREAGANVFGPSKAGAQLESSKIFSKEFMTRAGVPTAKHFVVNQVADTLEKAKKFNPPYVLKADGLAGGKGVSICQDLPELKIEAQKFFEQGIFGAAGASALLEEFQPGWELSFLILTNGKDYTPLPLSQDNKRLLNNDKGPNTGGMGVVAPIEINSELYKQINQEIIKPTVKQLSIEGIDYRGVLYVGIMVTDNGPKVIEYNVRFGDPECQVIMPLLEGDWAEVLNLVSQGQVPALKWKPLNVACVVMAAEGYPEFPIKGTEIQGDVFSETTSSYFLHAGTKRIQDMWTTNGGRVLNSIALGSSMREAISNAYEQADRVYWENMQMRTDIGKQFLEQNDR